MKLTKFAYIVLSIVIMMVSIVPVTFSCEDKKREMDVAKEALDRAQKNLDNAEKLYKEGLRLTGWVIPMTRNEDTPPAEAMLEDVSGQ